MPMATEREQALQELVERFGWYGILQTLGEMADNKAKALKAEERRAGKSGFDNEWDTVSERIFDAQAVIDGSDQLGNL